MKNKELNNILDDITAGIRADEADDAQVSDAAKRVWAQLSVDKNALTMSANRWQGDSGSADSIAGCPDFQALIPTYLRGELSEARSLLLLDHTHECIPCRKALQRARESRGATTPRVRKVNRDARFSLHPVIMRWGIAAVLVIGLGLIALPLIQRYVPFGSFDATVLAADGPLYVVTNAQTQLLSTGAKL